MSDGKGEVLATHIEKPKQVDPFTFGDVIRFRYKGYMFAALRASNGLWFCTGRGGLVPTGALTYHQLVKILEDSATVEWTNEWRKVI